MAEVKKDAPEGLVTEPEVTAKPEVSALETFLEDGKEPEGGIDKALEAEAAKINAEVKAEPVVPEKKAPKEVEDVISAEYRTKYKIPDNIKTMKALAEWGPNAEKRMQQALSERDKVTGISAEAEKRIAKMEEALDALNDKKVHEGEMTEEQRTLENDRMRFLMENDPVEYTKQIKEQLRQEALTEQQKRYEVEAAKTAAAKRKEEHDRYAAELEEIKAKHGEEKYESEVLPALKKIAAETPGLTSFKVAEKLYLHDVREAQEKAKADDEAKRAEKKASSPETSHRAAVNTAGTGDKEAEAIAAINPETASMEDLERAAGLRK